MKNPLGRLLERSLGPRAIPVLVFVLLVLSLGKEWLHGDVSQQAPQGTSDSAILEAYREQRGDVQVRGGGVVVKVLPDDTRGSQHQRFLLEIPSGLTLLVAHNIDLAPRIPGLREGDRVDFYGEYEWNDKGGVIHWTHHDPGGRHVGGWLEHAGQRYE